MSERCVSRILRHGLCALVLGFLFAGCFESRPQVGGETHFLKCEHDDECASVGPRAICANRLCRESTSSAEFASEATTAQPLVVLLLDTSASMERIAECSCMTPECDECLPDCTKGERNGWISLLEVLTGTFENYSCTSLERTAENGATFDEGDPMPHTKASGTQRDDGLLDTYRTRLRFGIATLDGRDTYRGSPELTPASSFDAALSEGPEGMWSYNPERAIPGLLVPGHTTLIPGFAVAVPTRPLGAFRYPNCMIDFHIDTGIRGPQAAQGAVRIAMDPNTALAMNQQLQNDLLQVRPFESTPIASAFDDLYYYLGQDAAMALERSHAARPYVVTITDGFPDEDYRDYGCDCQTIDECGGCYPSCEDNENDPSLMSCPYGTPEETARLLRCGPTEDCTAGPAQRLYIVGLATNDRHEQEKLDAIAQAGGDHGMRNAGNAAELRDQLALIFDELVR